MTPDIEKRINHLSQILKKLPNKEARWILADMEMDTQFDREALRYLVRNTFDPSDLLDLLTPEELKAIFKNVTFENLKPLLKNNLEKQKLLESIFGKNKYSEILAYPNESQLEVSSGAILDSLYAQIGEGKVSYNGHSLYFYSANCRPSTPAKSSGSCLFQILNPLVSQDEGIKLFIFSPENAGSFFRLSLQNTGNRYFNKDSWFKNIHLNDMGFYYGEIFPDRSSSTATVWLEIPGTGELNRTIYFSGAKATFTVDIIHLSQSNEYLELEAEIISRVSKKNTDPVKAIIYCSRCGNPLGTGKFKVNSDKVSMKFAMTGEKLSHKHDYFLHSFIGESQSITRFNLEEKKDTGIARESFSNRKSGDSIKFKLNAEEGETIFYNVSTSESSDKKIRKSIVSGNMKYSGAADKNFNRKATALELSINDGDLSLLSEPMEAPKFGVIQSFNSNNEFEYIPYKWENISNLYFTFYNVNAKSELVPFYSCESLLTEDYIIYPFTPDFNFPEENFELEIGYVTKSPGKIIVTGETTYQKEISKKGIFYIPYKFGQSQKISLVSGGNEISKNISIPEKKFYLNRISHIPKGTDIHNNGSIYTIFSSIDSLYSHILEKYLMNYPWGCGEQTAAKIAGFGLLLLKCLPADKTHFLVKKIKIGISALEKYKNDNGFYSIFSGVAGDVNTTTLIFNNLKILAKSRNRLEALLPELWKIFDDMKKKIADNPYLEQNGRSETLTVNAFDEKSIAEIFAISVAEKDGKLINYSKTFQSLASKSFYALTMLAEKDKDSLDIFAGKEKKEIKYSSEGFRGILEKWNILKQPTKKTIKTLTRSLSPASKYLLPASEISYNAESVPSTIDLSSMLYFLDKVNNKSNYEYSPNGNFFTPESNSYVPTGKITVQSDYTFVEKKEILMPNDAPFSFGQLLTISKKNLAKGDLLPIKYKLNSPSGIIHVILPAILEAVKNSDFSFDSNNNFRISHHFENNEFLLRTVRKGKGKIRLLIEDMYNTSQVYYLESDIIEVT